MDYCLAMRSIQSSEQLDKINATSFPTAKPASRQKYLNNLKKVIQNTVRRKKKQVESISEVNKSIDEQIIRALRRG